MQFEYDPIKLEAKRLKHGIDSFMKEPNTENLETRFEEGEEVLDYFVTDVVSHSSGTIWQRLPEDGCAIQLQN